MIQLLFSIPDCIIEKRVNIINVEKPSLGTYPLLIIREFVLASNHMNRSNEKSPLV